ncbi:MAG: AlpA family phage regulatory protein [Acidovorax sp.]|uniref:helix-turn-helix transcriptional regulator n=1 Tax=Acidovorax sp. TaxID=1872122 RepID=UPI0025C281BF|nr:AlpA family phage regulatory protein [Acidovorax sp.]MCE1194224.1 AlpA family phage regulatory protein [Acidovorax sp.]
MAKRQPKTQSPVVENPGQPYRPPSFDDLPDSALVRQAQLVPNRKKPGVPVLLSISAASLWRKVAGGTFPKPIRLGARTTAWRVGDVRAWLAAQQEGRQ